MKKRILILFVLTVAIRLDAQISTTHSDTLENKGVYSSDSLIASKSDSIIITDSLITKKDGDENVFVVSLGIDDGNSYISRIGNKKKSEENYRSLADIFNDVPFSYNQDLGAYGQANEQMFYGLGFGNISYSRDGILLNNRWQNSYNLNKLNNELIDSIEVAPITKGFLYSTYNNPVSISMNSRFNFPSRAITQLKFSQASFDEGMVDVVFHTPITKKLGFGINVSNSAIDSRFSNSDYESWKLNAHINYQVNDKININANYFYSYDTLALFGGLGSNQMLNENYSTVLYEILNGKSSRYQLSFNNHANVKILAMLFPNSKTDLTFYFNSNSEKFIQNRDTLFSHLPVILHDNYHQTFGVALRNFYSHSSFSLDIIANYETTTYNTDVISSNFSENVFTISSVLKFPLISNKYFIPSLFGKINNFNGVNMLGYGADISGSINNFISYYAGISNFQQQVSLLERVNHILAIHFPTEPSNNLAAEIGMTFNYKSISGKLSYFSFASDNHSTPYIMQDVNDSLLVNELSYYDKRDINNSGVNLNINFVLWKFLFSNNFSYYFSSREERVYASPDYSLAGKIFFQDILFNKNLNLRTGVTYRLAGGQLPFVYDFEKSLQITTELTPLVQYDSVPSSFQLDLFLAGTIQESATIFVTLENVLDTEYYIVPYYFKQPITLRFGVSWLLFD
ncbi:MAG: hypothetical protein PF445_03130 [Melioribacteraceae bacterium]|jgi:hypothetical protein|nr:hypothetical protein [Melioribacteraceae bacterium]